MILIGQMTATDLQTRLRSLGNDQDAAILAGFFKTGPGQYGEGDVFIGVRVPVIRKLEAFGYIGELGRDHLYRGKRQAFNQVFQRLDRSICATCTARIFQECATIEGPAGHIAAAPSASPERPGH